MTRLRIILQLERYYERMKIENGVSDEGPGEMQAADPNVTSFGKIDQNSKPEDLLRFFAKTGEEGGVRPIQPGDWGAG